jgi:hypothetical protein
MSIIRHHRGLHVIHNPIPHKNNIDRCQMQQQRRSKEKHPVFKAEVTELWKIKILTKCYVSMNEKCWFWYFLEAYKISHCFCMSSIKLINSPVQEFWQYRWQYQPGRGGSDRNQGSLTTHNICINTFVKRYWGADVGRWDGRKCVSS